ncbi:hypothetical protein SCHPADRAFT_305139 [Schizopora paradoxa]|uniref:Uncharacterized protein n=1 Tax=Schizopora paradoxa TaxID=27342 RepID=A0A0H2RRY6_9AGAM|nr:hypothetical protein SCHPADRAFT_305139 [Schizopora paradoxa]
MSYSEDTASTSSRTTASSSSNNGKGRARERPPSLRLHSIGVDPSILAGKVLKHIRRSSEHPAMSLSFADGTTYQILVDGYDPRHKGVPKVLETMSPLEHLFNPPGGHVAVDMAVTDCTLVTMADHAFEAGPREQRWYQKHLGIAFRFDDDRMWHCISAMLEVRDEESGRCTFRSYDDVYLQPRVVRDRASQKGSERNRRAGAHAPKTNWKY